MAWQAIAAQLVVRGGLWLLNKYVLNDEKKAPRPRPEEIDFPLTELGSPAPIVYGTVRLDSPLIVWQGNEVIDFDALLNRNVYRADFLFVLGVPPEEIDGNTVEAPSVLRVFYGDLVVDGAAFAGGGLLHTNHLIINTASTDDAVFKAVVEFFDGRDDQAITNNPTLPADNEIDHHLRVIAGVDGGEIPGYGYQMLLAVLASNGRLTAGRLGIDPHLKALGVEVRARGFSPLTTGFYDANPAWVLYDLICGQVWKLGYPTAKVDRTTFEDAAAILDEEEHGCSVALLTIADARQAIAGLLDQIDGQLIEDAASDGPPTIKLRLIRPVDLETVTDVLDKDNMLSDPQIQVVGWSGTANQVEVGFTNRALDYKRDFARAERMANAIGQDGRPRIRRVDFPFVMNATLAAKLATRELGIAARPLLAITVSVTRAFVHLTPGDVVLIDRPDLNLDEKAFRVVDVDLGQLAAPAIRLTLVEDVFGNELGGGLVVDPAVRFLLPIHERLLTETPAWMQQRLYASGILTATSADPLAYAFAVAANPDDSTASTMKTLGTDVFVPSTLSEDKPPTSEWQKTATVKTEYPRSAEPYDTTVGLELENVTARLDDVFATLGTSELSDTDVSVYSASLSVLYDDEGNHEFIAWQASSAITGGRKLTKVWRGLFDTAPRTWPVGTRFVHLHASYGNSVGRTPRFETAVVEEQFVPTGSSLVGSGDDPIDTLTVADPARQWRPMPVTDFAIAGPDFEGTEGQPAAFTGALKAVSLFDGHAAITNGNRRSRTEGLILRGDEVSTPDEIETYSLLAQKASVTRDAESVVTIASGLSLPGSASYWTLGAAGHGTIDVSLRTIRTSDTAESWTDPTIRVVAPHWRNLLVNSHALAALGTTPSATGWSNVTGTVQASQGTSSPSQKSTGAYFTSATASGGVTEFRQVIDVCGFKPEGLTATLDFYYRNLSSDADDTIEVEVEAIASNGTTVLDSATSGAQVGDTALWTRASVELAIPASTIYLRVTVTLTAAGGGDTAPSSAFAEPVLRLGQTTAQLLDNPSFDEVEPTLALALEAFHLDGPTTSAGEVAIPVGYPEESRPLGYRLTLTVVGSHSDVVVSLMLPYRGTTTSGLLLTGGVDMADIEAACDVVDATVDASDSAGAGPLVITWTFAELFDGEYEFVVPALVDGEVDFPLFLWRWGTSGVTSRTSTSHLLASAESNEATATGAVDTSVVPGDIEVTCDWHTSPMTEDEVAALDITANLRAGESGGTLTVIVQITDAVTCSSPTTADNTGGWTIGSWTSPGGGIQWQCTMTKSSAAVDTSYISQFETTPSEAGTIVASATASWSVEPYAATDSDSDTVDAAGMLVSTMEKTAGTNGVYDAGASTVETFAGAGKVEITVDVTTKERAFGLSTTDADADFDTINRGMILTASGGLYKVENGSFTSIGSYSASDVLVVERDGSNGIAYKKNGTTLSTGTSLSGSLRIDTSISDSGGKLPSLKLYDNGVQVGVTWQNVTNVTIT